MKVVDEILIVGKGMNGFNVSVFNAPFFIHQFQHGDDSVRGARGSGINVHIGGGHIIPKVIVGIHPHDNVGDVAFARRRQDHFGHTFGF